MIAIKGTSTISLNFAAQVKLGDDPTNIPSVGGMICTVGWGTSSRIRNEKHHQNYHNLSHTYTVITIMQQTYQTLV